eukprot:g1164.t1
MEKSLYKFAERTLNQAGIAGLLVLDQNGLEIIQQGDLEASTALKFAHVMTASKRGGTFSVRTKNSRIPLVIVRKSEEFSLLIAKSRNTD